MPTRKDTTLLDQKAAPISLFLFKYCTASRPLLYLLNGLRTLFRGYIAPTNHQGRVPVSRLRTCCWSWSTPQEQESHVGQRARFETVRTLRNVIVAPAYMSPRVNIEMAVVVQ